ncbi:hypothetical protein [Piscirickettsia litoralis]|uniref:Uncharacterized protein n=1 Tax=Piscirickettsia litoralis TaxID=1891921 RepID=A0ABX3A5T9_9GAMM|nr:hypothetical protein [Piscirickettsia litoralis]ODN43013.1 hypothetical protein BGC07_08920 [Piscirickettsia litoralis]
MPEFREQFRQRDYLVPVNPRDANCYEDFRRDFGADVFSMDGDDSEEIKRDFSTASDEAFEGLLKKHFFDDDAFVDFVKSHLHQGGVPYSLQRSILATLKEKNKSVMLIGETVAAERVFKVEGENLVIKETVKVPNLYDFDRSQWIFDNE